MSGLHIHPRFVLGILAISFGITAQRTLVYPPDYLLWASWWAVFAMAAAAASVAVAVFPRRSVVATAGSLVVFCSLGRGIAIFNEVLSGHLHGPTLASFTIAASTWIMSAVLGFVAFQESILPWSIAVGNRKENNARRNT